MNTNSKATARPDRGPDSTDRGLSAKGWTALCAVAVVVLAIGWVVADLLTARPAPNPEIRSRVVELTTGVQPDPDAPNRYEELKAALADLDAAVAASEATIRSEYDDAGSTVPEQALVNFSIVLEGPDPSEPEHTRSLEATMRVLRELEQSDTLDSVTELLRSPNLANEYGISDTEDELYESMLMWTLEELSHFRIYTSAQAARARLASEAGDHQRAAEILLEVAPLPGVLTRQAFLVEQLVGNATAAVILDELNHLATRPGIDAEALDTLRDAHRSLSDLGPVDQAIKGERLFIEDIHYATHTAGGRYIPSAADNLLNGFSGYAPNQPNALAKLKDATGYYFARRDASLKKVDDLYGGIERALAEPDPAARDRRLSSIEDEAEALSPRYQLLQYVIPSVSRAFKSSYELRAKLVHTRVLLAMAQHHADTGEWAAAVEELVPEYLNEVPIDPATNKPIRFRHDPTKPPAIEQIGN